MTAPVSELIIEEVARRLEEITEANGFAFDIGTVWRPSQRSQEMSLGHHDIDVVMVGQSVNEDLSHPGNPPAVCWEMTLHLHCVNEQDRNETESHSTLDNEFAAAVHKAIVARAADQNLWYTMDGNAVDTRFGNISPFLKQSGDYGGVTMVLNILYRVSEDDPTEARA